MYQTPRDNSDLHNSARSFPISCIRHLDFETILSTVYIVHFLSVYNLTQLSPLQRKELAKVIDRLANWSEFFVCYVIMLPYLRIPIAWHLEIPRVCLLRSYLPHSFSPGPQRCVGMHNSQNLVVGPLYVPIHQFGPHWFKLENSSDSRPLQRFSSASCNRRRFVCSLQSEGRVRNG